MRNQPSTDRARPGFLALLLGACLVIVAACWIASPRSPASSDEAETPSLTTASSAPAPASSPVGRTRVRSWTPRTSLSRAADPAQGTATALAESPGPDGTMKPSTPAMLAEAVAAADPITRARMLFANPQLRDPTGATDAFGGSGVAAAGPEGVAAQPGVNGVEGYREADRLRQETVQDMRAVRGAAMASAAAAAAVPGEAAGASDPVNQARVAFANLQSGDPAASAGSFEPGAEWAATWSAFDALQAYRETERLKRERIQVWRPIRNAAILAAQGNGAPNP